MSWKTRLLGCLLCLAGGYVIGFGSQSEASVRSAIGQFQGSVTSVVGVQTVLSSFEWFLVVGVILFVGGLVTVALSGGVLGQAAGAPASQAKRDPNSCRYCGASMSGSTTYCPNCGKSQS
jgi:hypothetical protein